MLIWIIARGEEEQSRLSKPLVDPAYQFFCEPNAARALAALENLLSLSSFPDLYVLGWLGYQESAEAIAALRGHPLAKAASLLVVDEKLTAQEAESLLKAGADVCYRLKFLPTVYSARARLALTRKRR